MAQPILQNRPGDKKPEMRRSLTFSYEARDHLTAV